MSADTSPAQALAHAALVREMSSEQRAAALRSLDRGLRRLVLARLRHQHPGANDRELVMRHVAQVHGLDVARRVYGDQLPLDLRP